MAKTTLEERIQKLEHEVSVLKAGKLKLKGLKVGNSFVLAGLRWKIVDISSKGYHCLAEIMKDEMILDSTNNNWSGSGLRKWLNTDFLNKLAREIGEENVVEFERDLLSLDGQTEYGKCRDKVSLLNVDEYRKYRPLIPNTDEWWWLITSWSTKCNNDSKWNATVSPSGYIYYDYCLGHDGVRPFCIFSSTIFESEE